MHLGLEELELCVTVQSRLAETRFAETPILTLTLTLNPNFGETGSGETGRHRASRIDYIL